MRMNKAARQLKPVLALFVPAVLLSCGHSSTSATRHSSPLELSGQAPRDRLADDLGRFLAGLPGSADSPFTSLQSQEAWREHRRDSDLLWERVETQWIPAMREFQKAELTRALIEGSLVFYPFSGPDALMVTVLFPRSPVYVMVGLEPVGTFPTLKQIANENLAGYLAELRNSVSSELERSFFITREMDREFRGQVTDGLLPPILLMLARTRHTILGHRFVRLDTSGRLIERAADHKAPGRIGNKGVEIDFRADADGSVHRLFYFSVNLSDEWLEKNKSFMTFLDGLKGMTTFLKATFTCRISPLSRSFASGFWRTALRSCRMTRASPTGSSMRHNGRSISTATTLARMAVSAGWNSRT